MLFGILSSREPLSYLKMKTNSKWRQPQNEDDLKMKMTSKCKWPQNKEDLKMKITSKYKWPNKTKVWSVQLEKTLDLLLSFGPLIHLG